MYISSMNIRFTQKEWSSLAFSLYPEFIGNIRETASRAKNPFPQASQRSAEITSVFVRHQKSVGRRRG